MKGVEAPWTAITRATIHRYSTGGRTDQALTFNLSGARCRYLRVRIDNGSDPPLHFDGATVTRQVCYVRFLPELDVEHDAHKKDWSHR